VIQNDGLRRISEISSGDSSQEKYGRRKGKLDAKAAEKARRIRKVGACWYCWVMKVPVSFSLRIARIRLTFDSVQKERSASDAKSVSHKLRRHQRTSCVADQDSKTMRRHSSQNSSTLISKRGRSRVSSVSTLDAGLTQS
jgi:hypothetical protein